MREVRELYGLMADIGCLLGVLITTSRFTADARSFASRKHISLMPVDKLLALILGLPESLDPRITGAIPTARTRLKMDYPE